jgi:hypothetical protein
MACEYVKGGILQHPYLALALAVGVRLTYIVVFTLAAWDPAQIYKVVNRSGA